MSSRLPEGSNTRTGPTITALPEALQAHIDTLQGGFSNCGRITNSLTRLDAIHDLLEDVLHRRNVELKVELGRLHRDVEGEQVRLDDGLHQLRDHCKRLEDNFNLAKQRTQERLAATEVLLSNGHIHDCDRILGLMKTSTSDFNREIRAAGEDLLRMESQLVGLNAWNIAWPEALRTVSNAQRSIQQPQVVSPPQYEQARGPT
ncbi:hypothetical protein A4X13_0g4419 [Tilletia indica]|uniref:Uncharacterized protein n=1 Tax=Tilletia indica TaxID=43049 RepID=A0A177TDE2_9BASI|nr:hypothetical protein A4X13_0g4419 [Tilletia indica]